MFQDGIVNWKVKNPPFCFVRTIKVILREGDNNELNKIVKGFNETLLGMKNAKNFGELKHLTDLLETQLLALLTIIQNLKYQLHEIIAFRDEIRLILLNNKSNYDLCNKLKMIYIQYFRNINFNVIDSTQTIYLKF